MRDAELSAIKRACRAVAPIETEAAQAEAWIIAGAYI
jgi:hypothetical protein